MGSHSVTCHLAEETFPPLTQPAKAGTRFSDHRGMQGWVVLSGLVTFRGRILAGRWSPWIIHVPMTTLPEPGNVCYKHRVQCQELFTSQPHHPARLHFS